MIADVPPRVLQLLKSAHAPVAPMSEKRAQSSAATMRALIAAGKAQGFSTDFIIDSLDRRVRRYLETVGNRSEGDRDNTAYRVARWLLNDFGASDSVAWSYLYEWNRDNSPPLSDRELMLKMRSAKRSGSRPAGCAHAPRRGSAA